MLEFSDQLIKHNYNWTVTRLDERMENKGKNACSVEKRMKSNVVVASCEEMTGRIGLNEFVDVLIDILPILRHIIPGYTLRSSDCS